MNGTAAFSASQLDMPVPAAAAMAHSQRLQAHIAAEIDAAGGRISFAQYMELVLYAPGLGYYSAGAQKFGANGDFITAPELSPLFGRCLAVQCQPLLASIDNASILELGAGSGALAATLLQDLASAGCLPEHYYILEVSADLRARQQRHLVDTIPDYYEQIVWLDTLPQDFRGVVIANEVLDALPVHVVLQQDGQWSEQCVTCPGEGFVWQTRPLSSELAETIANTIPGSLPDPYQTEINLRLPDWLTALAESIEQGLILFIDYGYPRAEYYHPQRNHGTLICHYRQRAHEDPFLYPGLQDISASVDFTLLAEAAVAAGLQVTGFTTQAQFLLACGLDRLLLESGPPDSRAFMQQAHAARQLVLPAEMGERFKVMALSKEFEMPMTGFMSVDQRYRL